VNGERIAMEVTGMGAKKRTCSTRCDELEILPASDPEWIKDGSHPLSQYGRQGAATYLGKIQG
jgi:hypothetical protein